MLTVREYLAAANQFDKYYGDVIGIVADNYCMSKAEVDILLFLSNHPQYDTARDIVEQRHIAKSYVSKSVDILIRRGYLSTKEDAQDRRVLHLKVLPEASEIVESGRLAQEKILSAIRAGVTKEEEEVFERVIRKMARNIACNIEIEHKERTEQK